MELTQIEVNNFRSIKKETIKLTHNCLVFVGKNEAGKSNVLRAIAGGLSQKSVVFNDSDKRNLLDDEDYENQEYFIDYVFQLQRNDIEEILKGIDSSLLVAKEKEKEKTLTLLEFFSNYFSKGIYRYDFKEKTSYCSYYDKNDFDILNIVRVKNSVTIGNKSYHLGELASEDDLNIQSMTYFHKLENIQELKDYCFEKMETYIKSSLPAVYYWTYSNDFLIPDRFSLHSFIDNPSSCQPLKNIFELSGIENITKAFQDTKKQCGDYDNLLDRVSKKTSEKVREAWPDLKNLRIVISENTQDIKVKIQEKIKQNVSARSDGFKKFISILCMLASPIEKGKIKNAIIVLDEPDNGLYPTGAGYLRDMLIKMSENNVIFYSTHNPCMIDKTTADRHIIVEKKDDITTLKTDLSDSKFRDDEVLLRAIGMSAFENIKETNIIFEGWTDYKIFNTVLNSNKNGLKSVLKFLLESGNSYGNGTNSLKYFIQMIKLLNKKTFVILDADQEGKDKKRALQQEFPEEYIYTLDDFGNYTNYTLEDFIKDDLLQLALNEIGSNLQIKDKNSKNVMQFLSSLSKENRQKLKTYIGKNIKLSYIKDEYFEMLKKLKEKMEETNAK